MFAEKLFYNKKAQYARAMRRYYASQERVYRQLKARHLYNQGDTIDKISYELGVGIDTISKYLRETQHLTDEEIENELSAIESQIQSQERFARFMLGFIRYFFFLLFYFLFLPFIFEAFESDINWWMFFWGNWWVGVVALPIAYYLFNLYKSGAFKKIIPPNVEYHTKINGLRHRCSSNYLNTIKEGDKLVLELDRMNQHDKNAIKIINKQDNKHLGFIPKSFNKTEKIFQKLQDGKVVDCIVEEVYKNPKDWLNSHTIRIKIICEE